MSFVKTFDFPVSTCLSFDIVRTTRAFIYLFKRSFLTSRIYHSERAFRRRRVIICLEKNTSKTWEISGKQPCYVEV